MANELVYVTFEVGYVVPKGKEHLARQAIMADLDSMGHKDKLATIQTYDQKRGMEIDWSDVPSWIESEEEDG